MEALAIIYIVFGILFMMTIAIKRSKTRHHRWTLDRLKSTFVPNIKVKTNLDFNTFKKYLSIKIKNHSYENH